MTDNSAVIAQWAEIVGLGFALVILAWAVFRLTWLAYKMHASLADLLRGLLLPDKKGQNDDGESDSGESG